MSKRKFLIGTVVCICLWFLISQIQKPATQFIFAQQETCTGEFISVSPPLNDLGAAEYIRLDDGATGYIGGLYPGGVNTRPFAHETAGLTIANQITPLNTVGNPDPNGKIVLISAGMSNAAAEFIEFISLAEADTAVNPAVNIINGAQPGQTADVWADPNNPVWDNVAQQLAINGLTPQQVQIAWVKNVHVGPGDFPEKQQQLQVDFEQIARNLKLHFPNIQMTYYSSRTRSYTYWLGLSPEPAAFESAFAVRWMLERQIDGHPDLNFDPEYGEVVTPWLSWGPYLWINGTEPRSDGLVWLPEDMVPDCTHPSDAGELKVAHQLLNFFKNDTTTRPWFLTDPSVTPTPSATLMPTFTATATSTPTWQSTVTPAVTHTPTSQPTISVTPEFPDPYLIYLPLVGAAP